MFPHFLLIAIDLLLIGIKNKKALYISMIMFAISLYCYGVAIYFVPFFLLVISIYLLKKNEVSKKNIIICILIFSIIAMPMVIFIIISEALKERKNVFDIFLKGAAEGVGISLKIFPTLVGLFVSIGMLKSSGILDFIIKIITPILTFLNFPGEVVPLALLRPISGSASMAIATDIIKNNGVDSFIGILASVIMGSTETTLYTIAVYTGSVKVKNTRGIIFAALAADFTGIMVSLLICRFMF